MEQEDYERSLKRAKRARSRTRTHGTVVSDFKWWTGRWHWWPKRTERVCHGWNPTGGPALMLYHCVVYWLCLGFSQMEQLGVNDPRAIVESNGIAPVPEEGGENEQDDERG